MMMEESQKDWKFIYGLKPYIKKQTTHFKVDIL